jgi:ABC-type nitrate/sulfonate/bicarbonate transport system substrate-binding protein
MASLVTCSLALLAAACSSSASSTQAPASAGSSGAAPLSLTVGIPAVSTVFTDLYYGIQEGYFKKAGLNLTVQNVGSNGPDLLAAGKIDLFVNGLGTPLSMTAQGKPTTVVFATLGAGDSGAVTVTKKSGITNIMQLSGQRVAVQGVDGSSYGWGQIYSNYVVDHGGSKFNIVSVGTAPEIVQGLMAGQYSAAVITGGFFSQEVADGTASYLVNPSTSAGAKYIAFAGGLYPEAGWFGLKSSLPQKKEAVARFLAALGAANTAVHAASTASLGATLHSNQDWAATPASTIAREVSYDLQFMDPSEGNITSSDWTSLLAHLKFWNISGLNLSGSAVQYGNTVDMSYLNEANSLHIDF